VFVGHGLLAFALVVLVGERLGWDRTTALPVAVLAGLFGTLPDVDVVYGLAGLLGDGVAPEAFWAAGNRVHRGLTHALPVGVATALAAGSLARDRTDWQAAGAAVLAAVVAAATVLSGPLTGAVATVFAAGALGLAVAARRWGVSGQATAGAALVGLLTHPVGDLFTGSPPAVLYPFDAVLVAERVTLSADPTLHLLGAFAIELGVVCLAAVAYCRVTDRRVTASLDRRVALGAIYGPAALVLPGPTLDVSYRFVYSVLAVGVVGVAGHPRRFRRVDAPKTALTALATVAVAAASYTLVYLLAQAVA